jgi:hypothetical protein
MLAMALEGLTAALAHDCILRVHFLLSDAETPVDVLARLAWAGGHGRAGLTFTDVGPTARQEVRVWLCQKMVEEGWTVEPEAPESVEG